jgi:hypothetical protein
MLRQSIAIIVIALRLICYGMMEKVRAVNVEGLVLLIVVRISNKL